MGNVDAANQSVKASDLIQKVWQGYVPQAYADIPALKQWDQKTRASFIVRDILKKSGVDTSGLSFNDDGSLKDANAKTWLDRVVDVSPYVIGGIAGAGALGAFGGAGGATGGAPAAGGVLPSTTIGSGYIGPIAGGAGADLSGGAAASSLFTGGATAASSTPTWLNAAKAGGQIASDISSGRAKGRVDESNINNQADKTAIDLYREQIAAGQNENNYGLNASRDANAYGLNSVNAGIGVGNLDLAQKDYALAAPGRRAGNSVRGDILANAQDVSIDSPNIPKTTISGGLRPSMFSANTRELGGLLSSQALQQQKAGDTFAPLPKVPAYQPPPAYKPPPAAPTLTGPTQANGLDTGLNVAGYAGLGADLLTKYGKFFGL